jgi:glycosyltransferase involved in cell wall biosynthesis
MKGAPSMRVLMLSKFPPIQGGISAKSYWLARGLANSGIPVEVVTNADCVEPEYRITGCEQHLESLENIHIHNISRDVQWHIPYSKAYSMRLLNLTVKVIKDHKANVIDSGFLMPYGIVAFMASQITGVPYIVRHGGSDLKKFWTNQEFRDLFNIAIAKASLIITDEGHKEVFRPLNSRIITMPFYVPDDSFFVSKPGPKRTRPVIGYLGKVNYYWENKSLIEILEAVEKAFVDYDLVFVAQGNGLEKFKEIVSSRLNTPIKFRHFVPPWEVPDIISELDYVLLPFDKAIPTESNVFKEAVLIGKDLIILKDGVFSIVKHKSDQNHSRYSSGENYDYNHWINENICAIKSCAAQ